MRISVCIPTHERHALLDKCLSSLLQQTRLPDEIVVADSSTGDNVMEFARKWEKAFQQVKFLYVRTGERSVVSNRWAAFSHSSGDIVFYLDDDIRLEPEGIAEVLATFEAYPDVAGVGLRVYYEGPAPQTSLGKRFRLRWLGHDSAEPYSISAGGRSTIGKDCVDAEPIPVQWMTGGGMSFCREALTAVGPLPGLDDLFKLRIGKSADTVLSGQVGLMGTLVLLTRPLLWHPERRIATSTAVSLDAWRRGLVDTVGKAHILRWLARDQSAVGGEWLRLNVLSLLETVKAVLQKPLSAASWLRLSGYLYGSVLTVLIWRRVPETPREPARLNRRWLFI
jgi:glycosyltransferase involved in cell wall biosynthesis